MTDETWGEGGEKPLGEFIEQAEELGPSPVELVTTADPTPEEIEASRTEPSGPVYGGEGHGSGNARQLVCIQPMADRSAMSHKARIVLLDSDVREAMALAARRLHAEAMKYSNIGFEWNLDDIVFEHGAHRVIVATLRIARGDARFDK